ncbi:MAG: xanthine dehydrogenase family protein molybdopterin-binding subunit [Rhodospirillaceae bacterium]|nr:xanthine dehydrogenase family protein molybdopterin-binding subunit [Rhodospirillaceae bacterium]
MTADGIGVAVRRKEDRRFLTGTGRYTDDIDRFGQVYACFVRSPYAHASVDSIDTASALGMPGVLAVFTGADVTADGLGPLPAGWMIHSKDGSPMKTPGHPLLVVDRARYVGEAVAVVIAETYAQARDAADALEVEYTPLPATIATGTTSQPGQPQVHDDVPNNTAFDWCIGDKAATEAAFAKAAHITKLDIVNNRLVPNAMEPRAALGEYDAGTDITTLYTTSQNPHVARLVLSAFVQLAPEHKLRIVAPDVGGGFGSKIYVYPEETICAWAARKVKRPVKWTAERSESFLTDAHGRDHVTHAELAMDANGKILGLRVKTFANIGAWASLFSTAVPTYLYMTLLSGQYDIPAIYGEVDAVYTHTTPVDAYRGAGRPEATFVVERIMETAARELKLDPAELRRRNFIQPDQFPYQTAVIMSYDIGDYDKHMTKALELADYANYATRKADSAARGKLRGVGFSCYIEACGIAPSAAVGALGGGVGLWESGAIRFNPTGNVTVHTGSHSHGQGHETAFAQLISSYLGVPVDQVEVVHGDTMQTPFGMGTYGSRSLAVGGSALVKAADKIVAKGKKIAAHLLEASEADIEFADGKFTVAGTDKAKSIQEVAFAAYVPHNYPEGVEPGLEESAFYDPLNFTFPSGTQICEVEVDPDTGVVEIVQFVAVDDFGKIINPMIVEGQVHGGIAQGVGQALMEQAVYDQDTGQLLSGSYMDYCMPRADDFPTIKVGLTETPCTHNPLGVKGCGEAGAIAAPAAVMNAVTDAVGTMVQMPATPQRVWDALQSAAPAAAAE